MWHSPARRVQRPENERSNRGLKEPANASQLPNTSEENAVRNKGEELAREADEVRKESQEVIAENSKGGKKVPQFGEKKKNG